MFNFIKKTVKYVVVYPIAVCAVIGFTIGLTGWEPSAKTKTAQVVAVKVVEAKLVETARHTACRLALHKENPYGATYNGLDVLVWDTDAFGTYNDGEVWVGYNRKVGDKVFYNMSKIC